MRELLATSISQFQELHEEIARSTNVRSSTMQLWFRGQASKSWPLLPSLYRLATTVQPRFERELVRDFITKSAPYLKAPASPTTALFVMQHYGGPTRLLDWSEYPLVALFFAVDDEFSDADPAVWILSPWRLNELAAKGRTVPSARHKIMQYYLLTRDDQTAPVAPNPLAVRAPYDTPRVRAQAGVFTIHGSRRIPLEEFAGTDAASPLLAKVTIPRGKASHIKRELFAIGVSRGRLFPDLDGLTRDVAYRYSSNFWIAPPRSMPTDAAPEFDDASSFGGSSRAFPRMTFDELQAIADDAPPERVSSVLAAPVEMPTSTQPSLPEILPIATRNLIENDDDAKRLARLIVDEIALYNPDALLGVVPAATSMNCSRTILIEGVHTTTNVWLCLSAIVLITILTKLFAQLLMAIKHCSAFSPVPANPTLNPPRPGFAPAADAPGPNSTRSASRWLQSHERGC